MKGKIVQVSGPVIDVEFEGSYLPAIKDALYVIQDGKKKVMEVSQHTGNNVVRCIMLAASEGLCKDMEVIATGSGISVPVGEKTLGRLLTFLVIPLMMELNLMMRNTGVFTEILHHLQNRVL